MDLNSKKEEFSYGYLQLLCATNGLALEKTGRAIDNIGIDVIIKATEKINNIYAPRIDVQVKCTSQDIEKEDVIKFQLKVKTYNQLREENVYVKNILVVVIVPKNLEEWLVVENARMILKKCGYWICLQGYPETENTENITIDIPKDNIITGKTLLNLLEEESKTRYDQIQMIKSKGNDNDKD
jgi:hypothetical protein